MKDKDYNIWSEVYTKYMVLAQDKKKYIKSIRIIDIEATLGMFLIQTEEFVVNGRKNTTGSFIFTFGSNSDRLFNSFESGHNDNIPKAFPIPVATHKTCFNNIKRIFAKESTLYAIDFDKNVWTWGLNLFVNNKNKDEILVYEMPTKIMLLSYLNRFESKNFGENSDTDNVNLNNLQRLNVGKVLNVEG